MEEKKEEWKELLEEATLEDSPKKETQEIQSGVVGEPIAKATTSTVEKDKSEIESIPKEEEVMQEVNDQEEEVMQEMNDQEEEEAYEKKNKKEFLSRLVMIFVLGFLIGIAFKTEALKKVTVGYNDYLVKTKSQDYDINQAQKELNKARDAASEAQTPENPDDSSVDANPAVGGGEQNNQTQN
ncbi:MAG: hypothetical protein WA064_01260 [Candidatus Moraniibacteriota bacterium]